MIVLDATTKSLQILLAGAVTTNQLIFTASYADYIASPAAFTPGANDGITNGATPVTLVAAPAASTQRQVKRINVYNSDTAPATVTIRVVSGANNRTQLTVALQVGERIEYEDAEGFRVFTVAGAVKVTAVQSTVEPGYIDGLQMQWISVSSLTVSSGTCYIPSVGANVNFPSAINKAGLALSASTFYHVYGFLNSGVPDVEIVTTAPSSAYNGVARTKTGDTTRRYIGSILTDSAGNIFPFTHAVSTSMIKYRNGSGNIAPYRVLSNGAATTATDVSLVGIVPVSSAMALVRIVNTNASFSILLSINSTDPNIIADAGAAPAASPTGLVLMNVIEVINQNLAYRVTGAGGGAYIDIAGYVFGR